MYDTSIEGCDVTPKLCAACERITKHEHDTYGKYRFELYETYLQLLLSSQDGCSLCSYFVSISWTEITSLSEPTAFEISTDSRGIIASCAFQYQSYEFISLDAFQIQPQKGLEQSMPSSESDTNGLITTNYNIAWKAHDDVLDWARSQLHNCLNKPDHQKCQLKHASLSAHASKGPRRLLDLLTSINSQDLRLVENIENATYVTLSHCWGGKAPTMTTTLNLTDFKSCIKFCDLPIAFQDAVTISRKLGYRYLWIDTLCIVQDDPEDWLREASEMANIYRSSQLTIAFSAGHHCGQTALPKRVPARYGPLGGNLTGIGIQLSIDHVQEQNCTHETDGFRECSRENFEAATYTFAPLAQRAWTFQERFMSHRMLYFTASQLAWECSVHKQVESSSIQMTARALSSSDQCSFMPPEKRISRISWVQAVTDYSRRNLTYEKDRLIAFAAVAEVYSSVMLGSYWAGLWERDIHFFLSWFSKVSNNRVPGIDGDRQYLGPSWSWISNLGPVWYHAVYRYQSDLKDVSCSVKYQTQNVFAGITDAQLRLTAPCTRIRFSNVYSGWIDNVLFSTKKTKEGWFSDRTGIVNVSMELDIRTTSQHTGDGSGDNGCFVKGLLILRLGSYMSEKGNSVIGLLVSPSSEGEETMFSRIALIEFCDPGNITWEIKQLVLI